MLCQPGARVRFSRNRHLVIRPGPRAELTAEGFDTTPLSGGGLRGVEKSYPAHGRWSWLRSGASAMSHMMGGQGYGVG